MTCFSLTACSINSDFQNIRKSTDQLSECQSASMTISLDFEGTISGNEDESPCIIRINGYGAEINNPLQEEWQYTSYMKILGETITKTYDIAGENIDGSYIAVIKEHNDENWDYLLNATSTSEDPFLTHVMVSIGNEAKKMGDGTYSSFLDGNELNELIRASLDPSQKYNLSYFKWDEKKAPVSLIIDEETGMPSSYTVDCRIIGQQIAEMVAGKEGIRITVDNFTITVNYSDYNRINKVELPEILGESELYE